MFNTKRFILIMTFSMIAGITPLQASQAVINIGFNNGGHQARQHRQHRQHKKYSKSYGHKSGHYYNRYGKRFPHNPPYYHDRYGKRYSHNPAYYHNRYGKRFAHHYPRHKHVRACEEVVVRSHYGQPYVVQRKCYLKPYSGHYNTGHRVIHKRFPGQHR